MQSAAQRIFGGLILTFEEMHISDIISYCWWFRNPLNSPVEVGKSIPLFAGFFTSHLFVWDFFHQQYHCIGLKYPPKTKSPHSFSESCFFTHKSTGPVFFCFCWVSHLSISCRRFDFSLRQELERSLQLVQQQQYSEHMQQQQLGFLRKNKQTKETTKKIAAHMSFVFVRFFFWGCLFFLNGESKFFEGLKSISFLASQKVLRVVEELITDQLTSIADGLTPTLRPFPKARGTVRPGSVPLDTLPSDQTQQLHLNNTWTTN